MPEMTLAGLRVLVTRERDAGEEFATLLMAADATPVLCPAIEIVLRNPPGFDEALRGLDRFDWLALTSANAVRALRQRFAALNLDPEPALGSVPIATVGSATEAALNRLGGHAAIVAAPANADNLAEGLIARGVERRLILFPASRIAKPALAERLRAAGASVVQLAVYDTVVPRDLAVPAAAQIDVATFTSPSAVRNYIEVAGVAWFEAVAVVCIGPTTARAAREAGITGPIIADEASLGGMMAALAQFNRQREQVGSHGTG